MDSSLESLKADYIKNQSSSSRSHAQLEADFYAQFTQKDTGGRSTSHLFDSFRTIPDYGQPSTVKLASGQAWNLKYDTNADKNALFKPAKGGLGMNQSGASYLWAVGDASPDEVSVEMSFGPGSTNAGAVGLGTAPNPGTIATGNLLTINSVHCSFGRTTWGLSLYDGAITAAIASGTYPTAVPIETRRIGRLVRTGVDRIAVHRPDGVITTVRHPLIAKLWGPTVWFEPYQPAASYATDSPPIVYAFEAQGSNRQPSVGDDLAAGICGLPGLSPFWVGATALPAGTTRYVEFEVIEPITVTSALSEVTVVGAAAGVQRAALISADEAMQPARLISDLGTKLVDALGVATWAALSVNLDPGKHLLGWRSDQAATYRTIGFTGGQGGIRTALGASPFIQCYQIVEAYAVFASPPTAWTVTQSAAAVGFVSPVLLTWVPR